MKTTNVAYAAPLLGMIFDGVKLFNKVYISYLSLLENDAWNIYPEDLIKNLKKKYPTIDKQISIDYLNDICNRISLAEPEVPGGPAFPVPMNVSSFQFTEEDKDFLGGISELLCDLSNTLLWRHAKVEDRNISVINRKMKEPIRAGFKMLFSEIAKLFDSILLWETGSSPYRVVTGFVAGLSPKSNAMIHSAIKPESIINCDISKFFESTTYYNIITNNLFLDSMLSSIYFARFQNWPILNVNMDVNLFNSVQLAHQMNFLFMFMMPGLMHNGRIPTGAPFSPAVCNIVLCKIDIQILGLVRKWIIESGSKMRYTRYADDITISSAKYKKDDKYILDIDKVKEIENVLTSYGYHLKYSKTRISGKRDNKEITGVNITSNKPSISSEKKMAFAQELSQVRGALTDKQLGHLSWIKSVNKQQWAFCLSYYFVNNPEHMKSFMNHNSEYRFRLNNCKNLIHSMGFNLDRLTVEENMLLVRFALANDFSRLQEYFKSPLVGKFNLSASPLQAPQPHTYNY